MSEKSLTEMSNEEIIAEIQALRERRAQARERRNISKTPEVKKAAGVSDDIWDMLEEKEEA